MRLHVAMVETLVQILHLDYDIFYLYFFVFNFSLDIIHSNLIKLILNLVYYGIFKYYYTVSI